MSYGQWKQIIRIIEKYAGSKSGIAGDELKKKETLGEAQSEHEVKNRCQHVFRKPHAKALSQCRWRHIPRYRFQYICESHSSTE